LPAKNPTIVTLAPVSVAVAVKVVGAVLTSGAPFVGLVIVTTGGIARALNEFKNKTADNAETSTQYLMVVPWRMMAN
jgi:hypothetical protein